MSIPELRFRVYGANLDKELRLSGGNGTFRLKANLGDTEEIFPDVAFKMESEWNTSKIFRSPRTRLLNLSALDLILGC
jgi:hypothetical protein